MRKAAGAILKTMVVLLGICVVMMYLNLFLWGAETDSTDWDRIEKYFAEDAEDEGRDPEANGADYPEERTLFSWKGNAQRAAEVEPGQI